MKKSKDVVKSEKKNKSLIFNVITKGLMIIVYIIILNILQASQVLAANDPLSVINNLSTFMFGIIRAIGMIMLGWGIVQVGLALLVIFFLVGVIKTCRKFCRSKKARTSL